MSLASLASLFSLPSFVVLSSISLAEPIPIAAIPRTAPVNFEQEILPILQKNCLACHSASEASGDLVLESPQAMRKGGDSGPAVVAGKSGDSLLLKLASHADEPVMPPLGNKVAAQPLTSQELGLLKLWIDQGADGSGLTSTLSPQNWRQLPPGRHPIYAVALSPDGQFAACGRANQIFIYHVPTGSLLTRLNDPALQAASPDKLPGLAHLDVVQSLAFSKQGDRLASGGFRTWKLWRYPRDVQRWAVKGPSELRALAISPDRKLAALGDAEGTIRLWPVDEARAESSAEPRVLASAGAEVRSLCFSADGSRVVAALGNKSIGVWSVTEGTQVGRINSPVELHAIAAWTPPAATESGAAPPELLISGGADSLIRIWKTPRHLPQPIADVPGKTNVLASSADGKLLAMANPEGMVRVVDVESSKDLHQWQAHTGPILSLAFGAEPPAPMEPPVAEPSASDRAGAARLATAGADGTVRLWKLSIELPRDAAATVPPEELWVLRGSRTPVRAIAFRPDGRQLVAGAEDGSATIWNLEPTATQGLSWPAPALAAATISPDGKQFAWAGLQADRPAIWVQDAESGKLRHTLLGHEGPVSSLAFSPDGTRLVSGSADKTARVWTVSDPKFPELARLTGHTADVTAVAFNSDGQQVVTGSADFSVRLWSVADGTELKSFPGHTGPITAVAMAANNQPLSASLDKTVRVWNVANGQAARTQTEPAAVTAISLSRDGNRLAVSTADHAIRIYPAAGGGAQLTLAGHGAEVRVLAFSADGTRLVSGAAVEGSIVWDLSDGRLLEQLPLVAGSGQAAAGPDQLLTVAFGAAADRIVQADSRGGTAVRTLRFIGALRGMAKPVNGLAWHPNSQLILAGCEDGTIRGFNAGNYQQAFAANHGAPVRALALTRDGQRLASGGDDRLVKLWNPGNGGQLQPAQLAGCSGPVRMLGFSAEGTRVIAGAGGETGEVHVFSLEPPAGLLEQSLAGHQGSMEACAVLGEEGRVVSASSDGTLLAWEILGTRHLAGHSQPVTSVTVLPPQEGQPPRILSGSLDGTLRSWNALTGQLLVQLNHGGPVTSVAVRGDGQRFASASSNHSIKLWNAANNQQLAEMRGDLQAKALVARLTQEKNDATAKVNEGKTALDAAEKQLVQSRLNGQLAADALAVATRDVEAKAAVLTTASTAKAAGEKLAIEAASKAQAAASELEKAERLAVAKGMLATELAERGAQLRAATAADPANQDLAKRAADATAAAVTADEQAKAAVAAKTPLMQAATAAAQAAAAEAQKALDLTKPFNDATIALTQSQAVRRTALQNHEVAARDLKLATEAVPASRDNLAKAEALLKQLDAELAAAVQAEAESQRPIQTLAFSPDGRNLASGGDLGVIHTWDAENGQAVTRYAGHAGPVRAVAWLSPASLASVSGDKSAVVWEVNPDWRLERVVGNISDPTQLIDRVTSLDFSPDGQLLVTGGGIPSRGGEVKIWNVADGRLVREIEDPHTDAVHDVAFSPDGQFVASASADKYVKKFEVATGRQAAQFEGHTNYALGVAWRAGGKVLATCGADNTIRTWDAESGDRINTFEGYVKPVNDVRFVGQTQFAVTASGQSLVRMYNTDNGGVQVNYGGPGEYMYCVDATADPTNGIVVSGGYDGRLWIWRANGPVLHTIEAP